MRWDKDNINPTICDFSIVQGSASYKCSGVSQSSPTSTPIPREQEWIEDDPADSSSCISLATSPLLSSAAIVQQSYKWVNVKIGSGSDFIPGIIFNPSEKGLVYARTDIGGAYRKNADDSWIPLLDFTRTDYTLLRGCIRIVGTRATATFSFPRITLQGRREHAWTRNGRASCRNGLWKSTDFGKTWAEVQSFTDGGSYVPDPSAASDTSGLNNDKIGISFVTFDLNSGSSGSATPRIFVGVANLGSTNIYVTEDAGETSTFLRSVKLVATLTHFAKGTVLQDKILHSYLTKAYFLPPKILTCLTPMVLVHMMEWTDQSIISGGDLYFGFGGLAVDYQRSGTIMVAALNSWWPDGQIFRSNDSGATWSALWQ
ncbi:hypothetical protein ACEPAF_3946 [Sanghuangporus sanghuang]